MPYVVPHTGYPAIRYFSSRPQKTIDICINVAYYISGLANTLNHGEEGQLWIQNSENM